jgi:Na+/H+ antiporter NhaC
MLFIGINQTKSKRRGVTTMITFIIGMIVGAFIGVSAMAIVVAGKIADRETEELIRKEINNESTQTIC